MHITTAEIKMDVYENLIKEIKLAINQSLFEESKISEDIYKKAKLRIIES